MLYLRRIPYIPLAAVLLVLAILCGGCGRSGDAQAGPAVLGAEERAEAAALLDAQLGLLKDEINDTEYERCLAFMETLYPLRRDRLEQDRYEKSAEERRMVERLNQLYERYTAKYLGDGGTWGYGNPSQRVLAEYRVSGDGSIRADGWSQIRETGGWTEEDYLDLWDQILSILPDGAWRDFSRFIVFTDGEDETLAYVTQADSAGERWEIAVDPADAEDSDWFIETVLHEYTHYLTLNAGQADYTSRQTGSTYNEEGMVTYADSYLNAFYQAFWADYLDDRLANMDSYNFFLRHEDDFVTDYASTDPAEDIAESFTYFVLQDRQRGDAVWERKLNFFYDYRELVDFRSEVRARLGLE
ncbi:hypothetical protein NE684_18740 [Pseudoflavonifractor phocaeensis]|nr:hypothetical protein [Pseudoflavonifractor phocaeensis]MCQ4866247.1 hypothetical protein [Pseudoflavonifractor phocaeensis]MCQ4866254.1 hypothetical protein [Pseudoflavonifractor phocaeensis]